MVYTQGSLESLPADDRPDSHDKPPLTIIDDARPLYFLPKDNFAEEVLIPGRCHVNRLSRRMATV